MKNFYISCAVKYTDNTSNDESFNDIEVYSFIVSASSKKEAQKNGMIMAVKLFQEDFGNIFDNVHCTIDECYETSDDARTDY